MNENDQTEVPTLQGILASLLWLTAHPRRQPCLHHQSVVLQQMRYLAELPEGGIEPMLRKVVEQLTDEIESALNERLARERNRAAPLAKLVH